MKKYLISLLFLVPFKLFASNLPPIEVGLGTEYGGLGTQVFLPTKSNSFDMYASFGLFSYSTESKGQLGAGIGSDFYLFNDKKASLGLYAGVMHFSNSYEDLKYKSKVDIGGAINYKYHFSWGSLGASYNLYNGGGYPFVSVGFRF